MPMPIALADSACFDASARFHSARILRLFRNAPSITALVVVSGGDRLQQDHRLLRQLFQADLSDGKAHAAARNNSG